LIGTLEAQAKTRWKAEGELQIQGAMIGADAVVDVQEEWLHGISRTLLRLSGVAIRAVDELGRNELKARWFASQIAKLSSWMLVLGTGIVAFSTLPWVFLFLVLGFGNESILAFWLAVFFFWLPVCGWPLLVSLLLRFVKWPQLLQAAAISYDGLGMMMLAFTIAMILSCNLCGLITVWLLQVLPMSLAFYLARRARRISREYLFLAPDAGQRVPRLRRATGVVLTVVSVVIATLLLILGFSLGVFIGAGSRSGGGEGDEAGLVEFEDAPSTGWTRIPAIGCADRGVMQ
jgi:hypothetical protein